jgi:hypothetical protein
MVLNMNVSENLGHAAVVRREVIEDRGAGKSVKSCLTSCWFVATPAA